MTTLAIIGGSGLTQMNGLTVTRREMVKTPYGAPSSPVIFGELFGQSVAFLARHGNKHRIPPHRVNYCANIWALNSVGITRILAVGAVGGIHPACTVGAIVVPDQIIDYTYDRENTFFDGGEESVKHIDFSFPYDETLRQAMISGGQQTDGISLVDSGTYGATQGPRLETAAEIKRMANDGCTIVGMTGMPEASLAAEMDIAYACLGAVVNMAAGVNDNPAGSELQPSAFNAAMENARLALHQILQDPLLD